MSARSTRFCPECGVENGFDRPTCQSCGHVLPDRDEMAAVWGRSGTPPDPIEENAQGGAASPPAATGRFGGGWPTARATPAAAAQPTEPVGIVEPDAEPDAARPRRGPGGCILGGIALLLIGIVAVLVLWSVVALPLARGALRDQARAEAEVAEALPVLPSGAVVVTEAQLRRAVDASLGDLGFIDVDDITIASQGIDITVSLLGATSTYSGSLALDDERVSVTDPDVSGPAGSVLPAASVADIVEEGLATLLQRSNLIPTAVEQVDGEVRITTVAASG